MLKQLVLSAAIGLSLGGAAFADDHKEGEAKPAIASVAAVVVDVSDLDASVAFYTEVLGASVLREMATPTYKEKILAMPDASGAKLVVIQRIGEAASDEIHTGRIVFTAHDAASAVAKAKAKGAKIVREAIPVGQSSTVLALIEDPDGNTLEFLQR